MILLRKCLKISKCDILASNLANFEEEAGGEVKSWILLDKCNLQWLADPSNRRKRQRGGGSAGDEGLDPESSCFIFQSAYFVRSSFHFISN